MILALSHCMKLCRTISNLFFVNKLLSCKFIVSCFFSMEKLELLLNHSNIDVNYKNRSGQTPLMLSISLYRSDSLILRLLEAGCDPNISDKYNETPLHIAAVHPDVTIMYELIKQGADINAQSKQKLTPLHFAVQYNNLEGVCMLLYYGAETNILCKNNMTPFTYALSYSLYDISMILVNYYCNTDDESNALYWALRSKIPEIPQMLIEMGANVNYITPHKETLLQYTLKYKDAQLFKLMWSKCDETIIANVSESLLWYCFYCCNFPTSEWLECLHLVLASPFGSLFIYNYCCYTVGSSTIVGDFLSLPRTNSLDLKDRVSVMYSLLKTRTVISITDVNITYDIYGYNDEMEVLIYFVNYKNLTLQDYSQFHCSLIPFILAVDVDGLDINKMMEDKMLDDKGTNIIRLSYYFCKSYYKSSLDSHTLLWLSRNHEYEAERIQSACELPSLLELSRTKIRQFIKSKYEIRIPYHFHDIVKRLILPRLIKDIILFKAPIY